MKEKKLAFDRSKHLLYSKTVKKVILRQLKADYEAQTAMILWDKTQKTYLSFLADLPYIGAKANSQSRGIYDSLALLAYYDAVPDKPSLEVFSRMNHETFVPSMQLIGKIANLNWPWVRRLAYQIFKSIEQKAIKHADEWQGNYEMQVAPYDAQEGIRYVFTRCPIADFVKKHGFQDIMPALCNPDYPMMAAMHGALIRHSTCANGTCCDYWIVGDKDPRLKKYPQKTDAAGYFYNDLTVKKEI